MKKLIIFFALVLPIVSFGQETKVGDWVIYHAYPGNTIWNNGIERIPFFQASPITNDTINGFLFADPKYFFSGVLAYGFGLKKCDSIDDNSDVECWTTIEQDKVWHPEDDFEYLKKVSVTDTLIDTGTTTFSGVALTTQYTVTHGLNYTPTSIWIQPKSANAAAVCYTDNYTSTTFRITFITVPVLGTNNITFDWFSLR